MSKYRIIQRSNKWYSAQRKFLGMWWSYQYATDSGFTSWLSLDHCEAILKEWKENERLSKTNVIKEI